MSTIKEVAELANVSIATVSNYLNRTKPVSKDASERIKSAIDELQYTQNLSAKSLKTNMYNDIGVILPNFNDSYYVQIFQGIESVFQNSPYYSNLAFSYDIPELETNILQSMLKKQVCGLILVTCQPKRWKFYYENFAKNSRPIVLIDRAVKSLDASYVSFDNRESVRQMTAELLNMDYRKIFLMTGPRQYSCEEDCISGFLDAHEAAGIVPHQDAIIQTELNREDAFRKTAGLLKNDMPELLLTTSELAANGIIEGLRLLGYSTSDIPVVTLGEEHWNKRTHTFATFSTARPAMKMGEQSARLLFKKLESPQFQESEQLVLSDNTIPDMQQFRRCLCKTERPSIRPDSKGRLRILMLDTPLVHTFRGLLKNFENSSGYKADITILPHHNLYDAIRQSHESDDADKRYDVYMYDIPWLPLLASQGVLGDITGELSASDTDDFLPGCLRYFSQFGSSYYGVPFMCAPQILYYRKDLFDDPSLRSRFEKLYGSPLRPPLQFSEFNAMAEFFTVKTDAISYGFSLPAAYDECLAPEVYMRLRACGSSIIDSSGKVVFDNPQTLKAYISLVRGVRFAKPDYMSATDVSIADDFLGGDTAMLISYPSFLKDVADLRKSSMIGSIGYGHIPGSRPLLGGWSLGVDSRSPKRAVALSFIKWTCNEQMGNYFALLGGQSAIASTYTNDELVRLYPWLPLYRAAYGYAKPMLPSIEKNGRVVSSNGIDAIVCKWAYRLISQDESVEEVIAGTQRDLESYMAQFE